MEILKVFRIFVGIVVGKLWAIFYRCAPYLVGFLLFLTIALLVGAFVNKPSTLNYKSTFEALTIGGMFVGTAAVIIFLSYVIFIVLTDYLMQLWREAKQKAKSE